MEDGAKECTFTYDCKGMKNTLTARVPTPLTCSLEDYVGRLVSVFNVPCFVEPELRDHVGKFAAAETDKFYADRSWQVFEQLHSHDLDISKVANSWSRAFSEAVKGNSTTALAESEAERGRLPELYHKLIHSRALDTLLNLEHTYSQAMKDLLCTRDQKIAELEKRQTAEMELAVSGLGAVHGDDYINHLAQRHFERLENETTGWDNEVNRLQVEQKREYHEWLRCIDADEQVYLQKARAFSEAALQLGHGKHSPRDVRENRLEESFTIHLGAQLKTTHNLRLLSGDALDLCRHSGSTGPDPQRLQTALSLYSNGLSGLVMLVDDRLNCYAGIKREFAQVCQQSTDFHFPSLREQFGVIEQAVVAAHEWHLANSANIDRMSARSNGSGGSSSTLLSSEKVARLKKGDFYVTKHSNLAEVHAVFHLVVDDENRLLGDISSRHPVIMGLRNVLKSCFHYDITTITVPLLLAHQMTEEMTISWCLKRAELVFKCVKGFMVEMSALAGSQSCTVQFLVPKGLSYDTFTMISTMLPGIFRQSNPIVAK